MNSYTEQSMLVDRQRQHLENLMTQSQYITAYHPSRLVQLCSRTGKDIVRWLTNGSMPRIAKTVQGESEIWRVYDPMTHRTLYFDNENALRVWVEERYYQ